MYCSVIIFDRPLQALSYKLSKKAQIGTIVQVPLGRQSCTGIIINITESKPDFDGQIREVLEIVDPCPIISPPLMAALRFMSAYYAAPLSFCLRLAMPAGIMRSGSCCYLPGTIPAQDFKEIDGDTENASDTRLFDLIDMPKKSLIDKVFEAMAQTEDGLTEKEIRKKFKISEEKFSAWVMHGVLIPHWILAKDRATETMEQQYTRVPDTSFIKPPGPKQKALLNFIEESNGPVRHSVILKKFGHCSQIIHRLLELGLICSAETARDRTSFDDIAPIKSDHIERTSEQEEAIAAILNHEGFGGFLLYGVTGSGKTEVYLGVIEAMRSRGKGCIFVLPEIALTPQFCAVFRGRFGDDVAVLHSELSEQERFNTWTRIRAGRIGIAIGPRSALFAPVNNLGVIVIDEEHDSSFKQGETPRYHARDMALFLGQSCQCPVILGSATPSLESYSRAMQQKLILLTLTHRPLARPMPSIEIVDMRNRPKPDLSQMTEIDSVEKEKLLLKSRLLSEELMLAIRETLARGEQTIIFLNRRGFSTFVQCEYCGYVLYCPNCDVALTYYKYSNELHCHYCDYAVHPDSVCPRCGRPDITYTGYGTERLVDVLQEELPQARIDRLDRDRASARGIRRILTEFREGRLDILVGTQMLAKGHDIHNVTLVGIVNADMSLHIPDFRASERTYQLLTQVSGRAGRGSRPGRVILQTLKPDHPAIAGIADRDYSAFAAQELEMRRALSNPPFASLIMFHIEGEDPIAAENFSAQIASAARGCQPENGRVLGPAPAPIPMIGGKMRYQIYLKCADRSLLHQWLARLLAITAEYRQKADAAVKCTIDADPYDMM